MRFLEGLSDIAANYDAFILDLWGVIHDGSTLYPHALATLDFLHVGGKRSIFLSNAPRRASRVLEGLDHFGVKRGLHDGAMCSGELAFLTLAAQPSRRYFFLGPERDAGLLDGTAHVRVDRIADAEMVVNCGPFDDLAPAEASDPLLAEMLTHRLPMHCANPDLVVVKQDGRRLTCAGAPARRYAAMGGEVIWYGKPYAGVYEHIFAMLGNPPKSRILAIGDGPETDIAGANAAGIDSVLVTGGILHVQMGDRAFEAEAVAEECARHGVTPTALLSTFRW